MARLEFVDVECKNFLSFGKVPQKLVFQPGVNLILGLNKDTNRSNMAGKSSILETIPFALFGKLNRNIRKDQIVNWKNRKNCEVILNFKKGTDNFKIIRKIKPDSLEIYHGNTLLPIPSDVRDYQKQLENEILEFDLPTFISIIHTNLNSLTPILKLDTPKKRLFLERVFNLGIYSNIIDKANTKLRRINENIHKANMESNFNNKKKDEITEQLKNLRFTLNSLTSSFEHLEEMKETLNTINIKEIQDQNITLEKELKELPIDSKKEYKVSLDILVATLQKEIEILRKSVKITKAPENIEELKLIDSTKEIEKLNSQYIKLTEDDESNKTQLNESISKIFGWKLLKKDILEKQEKLSGKSICPLCETELSGTNIINDLDGKLSEIDTNIIHEGYKKDQYEKNIQTIKIKLNTINNNISNNLEIVEQIKDYDKLLELLKKSDECKEIKDQVMTVNVEISELEAKRYSINESINKNNKSIEYHKELTNTINLIEKNVEYEEKERLALKETIGKLELEHDAFIKTIRDNESQVKKHNEIADYMECIKTLSKDENAKQYAISSIMPFLTQQVNHYLSQSGCGFYLNFTGFLEEEIKGPGITSCSYGNLSGSEARSVDLALQIAFIDILRLQNGIFPDIIVFDEILDSSIDSKGLLTLLKIIKDKQREDNSKVFIITHRSEIGELEADYTYTVIKEKGYSRII